MNIQQIYEWSKGNGGALRFLAELHSSNSVTANEILIFLEKAKSIRGTNLYVLFSDLCDKDINKVWYLCSNCPQNVLEDACSRQDRSGLLLVQPHLELYTFLNNQL